MKKNVILSVDTSTWLLSMSIYKCNKFYSINLFTEDHSENLVKCLDKLLKKTNLDLRDIDFVGVNIGPGSFTGLRIGLSFVKTLALNLNLKVICVNSFDIIFYEFIKKYKIEDLEKKLNIVALFPSIKNEFYFCKYILDDKNLEISGYGYLKIQDVERTFSDSKLIVPASVKEIKFSSKFEVFEVKFDSANTIIKIFLENKEDLYKLVKPKKLFPLYIRQTYY